MRSLLVHADQHVPYYRTLLRSMGFDPAEVDLPDDLARLPLLSAEDLRVLRPLLVDERRFARLEARLDAEEFPHLGGWWLHQCVRLLAAVQPLSGSNGGRAGCLCVSDGAVAGPTQAPLGRLSPIEIRPFTDLPGAAVVRPLLLSGSAEALARVAGSGALRPSGVLCVGPLPDEAERLRLERRFECEMRGVFALPQFGLIGLECERHEGVHYADDDLLIEVVTGDEQDVPGERGEIVITDLLSRAFPLVRLRTGLVGRRLDAPCGCGSSLPRLLVEHWGPSADPLALLADHWRDSS